MSWGQPGLHIETLLQKEKKKKGEEKRMGKGGRRRGREKERRGKKGGGGGRSGPEQEICSGNREVRSVADFGTGGADLTRDVGGLWIPPQRSPGSQLTLD